LALSGFLPLSWEKPIPLTDDGSILGNYLSEKINFLQVQRVVEEAIQHACAPKVAA
jgi:hypothetical protein